MWLPDPKRHPREYADAVLQMQEKFLLRQAMEDELLLFSAGFEPTEIAGVGELWRSPTCGCLRARESAVLEARIALSRGEVLIFEEWEQPIDFNADDYPPPDYPPESEHVP